MTFWLAPIDNFTNIVFRTFAKNLGYNITISEMCHTEEISFKGIREPEGFLKKQDQNNQSYGLQIIGKFYKISDYFGEKNKVKNKILNQIDFLNINFGCPSNRIVKNKEGSYLLQYPKQMKEYIIKIKKLVKIPINVKIRLGFNDDNSEKILESIKNEVNTIIIHARTTKQGYSGRSNWDKLIKLKKDYENLKIIPNGDFNYENISYIKEHFNDVMIGRHALNNPDIYNKYPNKKEMIIDFIKLWQKLEKHYETLDKKKILRFQFKHSILKGILMKMSSGMDHSTNFRRDISMLKTNKNIIKITNKYFS
ncbi:MAG: tRNA-dihydrouridine synthase family protein [Candidatus Woesearchaeota archaeon]